MDIRKRKCNRRLRRIRDVGWRLLVIFGVAVGVSLLVYSMFLKSAEAAGSPGPIEVRADVVSVYDGDTFTAQVYVWPLQIVRVAVRIRGIDTPEMRGKCEFEKELARQARDFVRKTILNKQVRLKEVGLGKYAGRIVADVLYQAVDSLVWLDLGETLLTTGYARVYDGGSREGWC